MENDTSATGVVPEIATSDFSVPGRHGVVPVLDGVYGKSHYVLSMCAYGVDRGQALEQLGRINALLGVRHRLIELRREVSGTFPRVAYVKLVGSTEPVSSVVGRYVLLARYTLEIPSGRWWDVAETRVQLKPGRQVMGPLQGGSAPFSPVLILTANGEGTNVKVADSVTGAWVRFAGNVTAGVRVWLFPDRFQAVTDGGADLSGMLDWGPQPFEVLPGADVTVTQNGSQPLELRARRGWLE